MKKFYLITKIWFGLFVAFLIYSEILAWSDAAREGSWFFAIGIQFFLRPFAAFAILTFLYHRDLVIDLTFDGDTAVITNNHTTLCLPAANFVEVVDSRPHYILCELDRVVFTYRDGDVRKRFVFQKRYARFFEYSLNMDEIRRKMGNATFRGGYFGE